MKVKMLIDTFYKKPLKRNEVVDIPETIAERWVKRNIAVFVLKKEEVKKFKEEVTEVIEEKVDKELKNMEDMTAKELYEFCLEQGLDVEPKKSKMYYLDTIANLV